VAFARPSRSIPYSRPRLIFGPPTTLGINRNQDGDLVGNGTPGKVDRRV